MYMCGAAFDFHCLEILVGNVWNLWIFKLWINEYMYKENMWLKLHAVQWCVWTLVAERGCLPQRVGVNMWQSCSGQNDRRNQNRVFVVQDGCALLSH